MKIREETIVQSCGPFFLQKRIVQWRYDEVGALIVERVLSKGITPQGAGDLVSHFLPAKGGRGGGEQLVYRTTKVRRRGAHSFLYYSCLPLPSCCYTTQTHPPTRLYTLPYTLLLR